MYEDDWSTASLALVFWRFMQVVGQCDAIVKALGGEEPCARLVDLRDVPYGPCIHGRLSWAEVQRMEVSPFARVHDEATMSRLRVRIRKSNSSPLRTQSSDCKDKQDSEPILSSLF